MKKMTSVVTEFDDTDHEIREIRAQLKHLGIDGISDEQLNVFKKELQLLEREGLPFGIENSAEFKEELQFSDKPQRKRNFLVVEKFCCDSDFFSGCSRSESTEEETSSVKSYDDRISDDLLTSSLDMERPLASSAESLSEATDNTDLSRPVLRKRKVLRRKNGIQVVCDETMSSGSSIMNDGLSRREQHIEPKRNTKKWMSLDDVSGFKVTLYKPKSVILPYRANAQETTYPKMDPVALYHYYQRQWKTHNIPGERDHRQLRWNVRTKMAVKAPIISRPSSRISLVQDEWQS